MNGRTARAIRKAARRLPPEQRAGAIRFAKRYQRRRVAAWPQPPRGYQPLMQMWPTACDGKLSHADCSPFACHVQDELRGQRKAARRVVRL